MAVYTPVTVTGYNTSPPPDDGSTGTNNQLTWAKHKDKLGDPLKTAVEAINTNVSAAFSSNSKPIVSMTHAILATSATIRSDTYVDTSWTITHSKTSTTSTLYVQVNGMNDIFSAWDGGSNHQYTYIRLAKGSGSPASGSTGDLVGGTTDDILVGDVKDDGHSVSSSSEHGFGFSRIWKVTAANCPDGTSGSQVFDIWSKTPTAAGGGTTFVMGTFMVWEIEE